MEKCYRKNPIHFDEMSHPHCNYLYIFLILILYVIIYYYQILIIVTLISVEKLLVDQLDGTIEIPEVLHFACNDRSQLLDQLKVLQMVLRRERNKNKDNQLSGIGNLSSKAQSSSTTNVSSTKEDLKDKVERHKKATVQRRQDKLKQMDAEAQALSRALIEEERENHMETIKVSKIQNKFVYFTLWKINK